MDSVASPALADSQVNGADPGGSGIHTSVHLGFDISYVKWHGFVYNFGGDGSFSSFDYPGITQAASYATVLTGINGQGRNCLATPGRCR